jgi:hypothetical protein
MYMVNILILKILKYDRDHRIIGFFYKKIQGWFKKWSVIKCN